MRELEAGAVIGALRRWWYQPDHYYWITATLAARGAKRMTCRLVSALALSLACLSFLMIFSPAGPHASHDNLIAVLVSGCLAAIALFWQRRRWPTRTQSMVTAGLTAVGIAATAVIHENPVSGFVAGSASAAVVGYLVFFHTPRYLLAMLAVALATVAIPIARVAYGGDVVWALSLLVAAVAVILAMSFVSLALVQLLKVVGPVGDVEPLTGLLTRDGFYAAAGEFIASRSRIDDRFLVVILVNLDNLTLFRHAADVDRARVVVGRTLRETTRRDAVVAHVADPEFLVADSFVSPDASALVERIRSSIRGTPQRLSASIGVVSTPMTDLASCPPDVLLDELIALATTAMFEARRSGGNRAEHVMCPRPTALDDYPDPA